MLQLIDSNNSNDLILDYRGYHIVFKIAPETGMAETIWENKPLVFGFGNTLFIDDMKRLIDRKLDVISIFSEFPMFYGAKLIWFNNGPFRDIKLVYRHRVLKIFLVSNLQTIDLQSIIDTSIDSLRKYLRQV